MANSLDTRLNAGPKLIFVLATVLLMGLAGWLIYSSQENARQEAEANTRNLVSVLEARLSATIHQVDANLKELAVGSATFILRPTLVATYSEETTRVLMAALGRTPEVMDYAYADASGNVLYAAKAGTLGSSVAEAPYFKALSENPKVGVMFSGVVKSMLDNRPGVVMARPVLAGDGHVMGAVLAFLDLGRVEALIPEFDLGESGVVAVRHIADGHLLIRKPFLAEAADKPLEGALVLPRLQAGQDAGSVDNAVDADGQVRLASFRRLAQYPFFVVAAEAESDFLQGWYSRSIVLSLALLSFLGLLAWLLTRLQRTQESLEEQADLHEQQERLLRSAIDEIPGIVLLKDQEGRFLLGNTALADQLGTSPEELAGKDENDFASALGGSLLARNSLREGGEEGGAQVLLESAVDGVTGESRYFQVLKKPFVSDAGETRVLLLAADVSDIRGAQLEAEASEKRLQFALEAAALGLWDWQVSSGAWFASARWCRMLGRPGEDTQGLLVTDFESHLPDGERPRVLEAIESALESGGAFALRHVMRRSDGEIIWVENQGKVVEWDEAGASTRMVGCLRDVTEEVRAEATLKEARDAAQADVQAKSDSLNQLAHGIRPPLHGILGMVEVLKAGQSSREGMNAAETVGASARKLLDVLSDLLDPSPLQQPPLTLAPSAFKVVEVVRDLVGNYRERAAARGLSLNCMMRGGVAELSMYADESRLRQVLEGLLDNAVKFTHTGSVTLTLSPLAEGLLQIDVVDTGIGMDEGVVQDLFAPDHLAIPGLVRAFGNSDRGLTACRQRVGQMGGELSVHSQPREGTRCTLVLPLGMEQTPSTPAAPEEADAAPAVTNEATSLVVESAPEADPMAGARVLLVDDNAITRQVANGMLDWLGCDTALASNGREALDRLRQEPFDLVLMDLRMPEMDGLEATRKLRMGAAGPMAARMPVIGMATSPSPEEEAECLAVGMNDYLSKAIDLDTLGEALARWIPEGRAPMAALPAVDVPVMAASPEAGTLKLDVSIETIAKAEVPPVATPAPEFVPAPAAQVGVQVGGQFTVAVGKLPGAATPAPASVSTDLPAPLAAKLEALAKQASILEKVRLAEAETEAALDVVVPAHEVAAPAPQASASAQEVPAVLDELIAVDDDEVPLPTLLLSEEVPTAMGGEEDVPAPVETVLDLELPAAELSLAPVEPEMPSEAPLSSFAEQLVAPLSPAVQAPIAVATEPLLVEPLMPPPPAIDEDPDLALYPAFDREGMMSLCMNDKDLMEVILRSALNDVSSYWESMVTAIRQGDPGTASFWVHTVKTLMSQAGGVCLEKKMERLESELKDGRTVSEGELVQEMAPALEGFRQGALDCLKSLRS